MNIQKHIEYWEKSANISTRYPDEQFKFYKLCTKEFTLDKFKKIKEKYEWLKQKIK